MKKLYFSIIAIFCAIAVNAQFQYEIDFSASGSASTIDGVYFENLSAGGSVLMAGDAVITVSRSVGTSEVTVDDSDLDIYPNPAPGEATISVEAPAGDAVISVSEITGKTVAQAAVVLDGSLQAFTVSGLSSGLYLVSVKGASYQLSGKLLSSGGSGSPSISDGVGVAVAKKVSVTSKGLSEFVDISITEGDTLLFKAVSGDYSRIVVMTDPGLNTTVDFNFIPCMDASGNSYPVVKIGDLEWMASSLRTTKYEDGTDITFSPNIDTLVIDSTFIGDPVTDTIVTMSGWPTYTTAGTGAYAYPMGDAGLAATHGMMYNHMALNPDSAAGNVCPTGWHVQNVSDLFNLLGVVSDSSQTGAWGALKEADTTFWTPTYSIGTLSWDVTGLNTSGYTARPTGLRWSDGDGFGLNGKTGRAYFWTANAAVLGPPFDWNYPTQGLGFGGGTGWNEVSASSAKVIFFLNLAHLPVAYGFQARCVLDY